MNELRPEIARLADATTDAERAHALLAMPLSIMMTCESTIRNRLMHARFGAGLAYVEAELAALRSPRDRDGYIARDVVDVAAERREMACWAGGGA